MAYKKGEEAVEDECFLRLVFGMMEMDQWRWSWRGFDGCVCWWPGRRSETRLANVGGGRGRYFSANMRDGKTLGGGLRRTGRRCSLIDHRV